MIASTIRKTPPAVRPRPQWFSRPSTTPHSSARGKSFSIDPTNTCGDGPASALKDYRVDTSVDGVTWVVGAVSGSFTSANMDKLNVVTPAGTPSRVRWVRLVLLAPQVPGQTFVDVTEFEVFGPQSSPATRPDHQGGAGGTVLGGSGQLPPVPR